MADKNLFIPVDKEFHQRVKEYCVKHEVSITDLVIHLLTKVVNKKDKS